MLTAKETRHYDYSDWEGVWEGFKKGDWEGMVGQGLDFELPPKEFENKERDLLTQMGIPPSQLHPKGFANVFYVNLSASAAASNPASKAKNPGPSFSNERSTAGPEVLALGELIARRRA